MRCQASRRAAARRICLGLKHIRRYAQGQIAALDRERFITISSDTGPKRR